jgi:Domain of unknown function (DUF4389)
MYPISYAADPALEGRNRLTTFFRGLVAIPWAIVATIYSIVAGLAAFIAWFAIVFTARYPEGIYNFNAGFLRMYTRYYSFYWLLTDAWPPFGGEEAPEYPIRAGVPPALDSYSRLKTGLRFLIGIPVILLGIVQGIILQVCGIIASSIQCAAPWPTTPGLPAISCSSPRIGRHSPTRRVAPPRRPVRSAANPKRVGPRGRSS